MKKTTLALSLLLSGSAALADTLTCNLLGLEADREIVGTGLIEAHMLGQALCVATREDYKRVVEFSVNFDKGIMECAYTRDDGKAELVKRELRASLEHKLAAECTYAL